MAMSQTPIQSLLKWATYTLGIACLIITAYALGTSETQEIQGRLLKSRTAMEKKIPWHTIESTQVEQGTTIPANSHVVFHLPENFERIGREVLFGQKGEATRYWGYCFPENYDPTIRTKSAGGLPGKLFLSEREREVRSVTSQQRKIRLSLFQPPSKRAQAEGIRTPVAIRHQVEVFIPNLLCYIMTETPLPLGLDTDNDRLNVEREKEVGTNPEIPDTDEDGIWDGMEVVGGTNPLIRDSDGDGLIDGLEDKNWNGDLDPGETDPTEKDSDRDGLCDGLCRIRLANSQEILLGEDVNLNGTYDEKESNPLKEDSIVEGTLDYQAYFNCQLGMKEFCI